MFHRSPHLRLLLLSVSALALVACVEPAANTSPHAVDTDSNGSPGATTPGHREPLQPALDPTDAPFVVHEWGTYTSLQGSDGRQVEGLHLTEERLPDFVHVRSIGTPHMKSMEALPEGVTQKLETPVIYFYDDEPREVSVEVDFPGGVISEWYPSAVDFGPGIGELSRMGEGRMAWDLELLTVTPTGIPAVASDSVWAPSRNVPEAAPIAVGDEQEHFIFYRGLGRFEMPIEVVHASDGQLHITNHSADAVPSAFLLKVHAGGGAIVPLGSIPARGDVVAAPGPKEVDLDNYVAQARAALLAALIDSGLYPDEARAMVDTWSHSYFRTPGLRILYVAPRTWTDAMLPIRIAPQPDVLLRTLVGRIEVMTRDDELALLAALGASDTLDVVEMGRFAIPRLRRIMELSDDDAVDRRCEALIQRVELDATAP